MTEEAQKKIVIAGGSGFLGLSLAIYLKAKGYDIAILSRRSPVIRDAGRHCFWDGRSRGDWAKELEGATGLVNLTGRSVDCIKTADHRDEILRSRVESTRVLGQVMRQLDAPPPVWVQMSTAHIYGDPPELVCTEDAATGYGLAPDVGKAWEDEFHAAVMPEQRGVILRTGFVIGRNLGAGNGALQKLGFVTRRGLGGRVGTGRQGMSWIHELDMNRIFERGLFDASMQGIYNVASPFPVPQVEFMQTLRTALRVPIGLPAFEWMIRIGAPLLLRTDPELALYGRFVVPRRLQNENFEFQFPTLAPALIDLLRQEK